jgi:glycosyltransferase involved in cell wall biosynthesis
MIRVAMVTPYPARSGAVTGGVEGVAVSLAKTLPKVGDVELIIVSPISSSGLEAAAASNPNVHWIERSYLPGFIDYWTVLRKRLRAKLVDLAPDIVHFQGAAGWLIGYKGPAVLTIHGVIERDARFSSKPFPRTRAAVTEMVERVGRKQASDVIVISPYLKEELAGQLRGVLWNIENPIEESWFEIKRSPDWSRVLYVGRISQRKNVDGLIVAFGHVTKRRPEAKLVLAGAAEDPTFEERCRRYVSENHLQDNIQFLGAVDRSVVLSEMNRASCLVLVSHQETAPLVIEEAMAAAVPVVASDVCGHPFMIKNGDTGFLVNRTDDREIADRMLYLIENPEKNIAMGLRARSHARERFHPEAVAKATVEVYRRILER